jgi:hypothetical protein
VTPYVAGWLRAFAVTLAVELPLATWLLAPGGASVPRRVSLVFLANLATHPIVWFVFPELSLSYPVNLCLSETWAVLIEALAFSTAMPALGVRRAFGVSALANGVSYGVGLALQAFGAPI